MHSKRKFFTDPQFSRVKFTGNTRHGCVLSAAACNPVFKDCTFSGNYACGVSINGSGRGMLRGCTLEGNSSCAIHVQGQGSFCNARDCVISSHAVAAVVFESAAAGDVSDSRLVGNSIAVITMSDAAPVMTRCAFSGCSGTAVVCGQNSGGKYDACIFSDNQVCVCVYFSVCI